jgi:hypothetical protein
MIFVILKPYELSKSKKIDKSVNNDKFIFINRFEDRIFGFFGF